ncbi:hypothetical protein [Kineococcus indalonis]|uniref:hypothetical protein n=1 Tax=Kineococcus indalonis TaxID=2696566 RepID=UPI00141352B0|nr:hypothetical protein [Kineococcus indalonis]NAZ88849.1 hypothetical protein [Kineococcus indalonis]
MNDIQAKKVGAPRGLQAQWVPVRDATGRTHMEMRWGAAGAAQHSAPVHRAA